MRSGKPFRRPRITKQAQKASQRESVTPDGWDAWQQCTETFDLWLSKDLSAKLRCMKGDHHAGTEHKARTKGGVVKWKVPRARNAEPRSTKSLLPDLPARLFGSTSRRTPPQS